MTISRIQIPPEIYLSSSKVYVGQNNIFVLDMLKGNIITQYQTGYTSNFTLEKDTMYLIQNNGTFLQALSAISGLPLWHFQVENDFLFLLYVCCFEPHYLFSTLNLPPEIDHRPWIIALHKSDGQPLWQKQLGISTHAKIVRSLACASDAIFATTR